jgi:hypothetical protein
MILALPLAKADRPPPTFRRTAKGTDVPAGV